MNCENCIYRVLKLCNEAEPMPDTDKTNCKDFIDVGKAVEKVKNNQKKTCENVY